MHANFHPPNKHHESRHEQKWRPWDKGRPRDLLAPRLKAFPVCKCRGVKSGNRFRWFTVSAAAERSQMPLPPVVCNANRVTCGIDFAVKFAFYLLLLVRWWMIFIGRGYHEMLTSFRLSKWQNGWRAESKSHFSRPGHPQTLRSEYFLSGGLFF